VNKPSITPVRTSLVAVASPTAGSRFKSSQRRESEKSGSLLIIWRLQTDDTQAPSVWWLHNCCWRSSYSSVLHADTQRGECEHAEAKVQNYVKHLFQ
jgi:hypothetical protein